MEKSSGKEKETETSQEAKRLATQEEQATPAECAVESAQTPAPPGEKDGVPSAGEKVPDSAASVEVGRKDDDSADKSAQDQVSANSAPGETTAEAVTRPKSQQQPRTESISATSSDSDIPADQQQEKAQQHEPKQQQQQQQRENQEPPAIEWDWMTGFPIIQYNYILQTMIPAERIVNYNTLRRLQLQATLRKSFEGEGSDVEAVLDGNAALFLHIPSFISAPTSVDGEHTETREILYDDYNVLLAKTGGLVCPEEEAASKKLPVLATIEQSLKDPGCVRLKVNEPTITNLASGDDSEYVSSSVLLEKYRTEHRDSELNFNTVQMAFKCSSWPLEAREWERRERVTMWPPVGVIKKAACTPCYVVGEPRSSISSKDTYWYYRFPEAEKIVAESLNDTQRQCYIFLKIFHLEHLDIPKILTSHHLTSTLFWMCERLPQEDWTPDNLAMYFLGLIDELLHSLIDETIRDFFMPECNLLANVDNDFLFHLMAKVTDLRKEPLKYLFSFNQKYRFLFSPLFESWQNVFTPILRDVEQPHDKIQRCYVAQIESSKLLMKAFAHQNHFDKACDVAESSVILYAALGSKVSAGDQLSALALELPLEESIKMHEQIIAKYPTEYAVMSNLACMYHVKIYQSGIDDGQKRTLQETTDETFRKSIKEGGRGAGQMDYAHFLFNMKNYDAAVKVLTELIEKEKTCPTSSNCYGESELPTMDEQLTREINNTSGKAITVLAVSYACYLLVKCYLNLKKEAAAKDAAKELESICEKLKQEDIRCTSLSLLGYSFYNLQEYDRAEAAFSNVVAVQPSNNLARENAELSQALKISLGQ